MKNGLNTNRTKYAERIIEARSCKHSHSGKVINITCSEYVTVALGVRHTMRMPRVILSSVACTDL